MTTNNAIKTLILPKTRLNHFRTSIENRFTRSVLLNFGTTRIKRGNIRAGGYGCSGSSCKSACSGNCKLTCKLTCKGPI